MTTVEATEVTLDLQAGVAEHAGRRPFGAADVSRRALHDGRVRASVIVVASGVIAAAFSHPLRVAELTTIVWSAAWILAVHLADRSLRTVRAVAGAGGMAAFSALGGGAIAAGISFWLGNSVAGRAEVLTMTGTVFAIVLASELARVRVGVLRPRVLLVGGGSRVHDVVETLRQDRVKRFSVAGIVDDDPDGAGQNGVEWLGPVNRLDMTMEEQKPDIVVVAAERGRPEVFTHLASVAELRFSVVGLPEFYEHAFGRVPVRNVTDAWFMSILHLYQRSYARIAKRTFDVAVAAVGLLLTAPLFPLIALLVSSTRGPVFYRQTRLGEHGRPFRILKFRTMAVDAETDGAVWAQESDPRVTRVGVVLRKTRLDEIPQLLNVLWGDMSIVGPRPERPEFHAMLEEEVPFWSRRHLLRPGITGWAQLRSSYASDAEMTEQKLAYDLWYLRHQSVVVDFLICVRTLPLLLLAAGR